MKAKSSNIDRYEELFRRQPELIRKAPPDFFKLSDQDLQDLIAKGFLNPLTDLEHNNRNRQFLPSSP